MDEISKLVRDRNRVIVLMAVVFVIWQGSSLVRDIILLAAPSMADMAVRIADGVETVGAIGWVMATLASLVLARRVKKARAQDVINDELFKHTQSRALMFGFKALVALLIVLMLAEAFTDFPAVIAIRAMMIVTVAAPLLAFAALSGSGNEAHE